MPSYRELKLQADRAKARTDTDATEAASAREQKYCEIIDRVDSALRAELNQIGEAFIGKWWAGGNAYKLECGNSSGNRYEYEWRLRTLRDKMPRVGVGVVLRHKNERHHFEVGGSFGLPSTVVEKLGIVVDRVSGEVLEQIACVGITSAVGGAIISTQV